jgi:hypothetical protein
VLATPTAASARCLTYATEEELSGILGEPVRLASAGDGLSNGDLYCDYLVSGATQPLWIGTVSGQPPDYWIASLRDSGGVAVAGLGDAAYYDDLTGLTSGATEELGVKASNIFFHIVDFRGVRNGPDKLVAIAKLVLPRVLADPPPSAR